MGSPETVEGGENVVGMESGLVAEDSADWYGFTLWTWRFEN